MTDLLFKQYIQYSLIDLFKELDCNKDIAIALIKGETVENFVEAATITVVSVILTIIVMHIVLWIVTLVLIIKNWDRLQTFAKIASCIFLFPMFGPFGPIIALIIVFASRSKKSGSGIAKFKFY
jgi:hypothetical protein